MSESDLNQLLRKRSTAKYKLRSFGIFFDPIDAIFLQQGDIEERTIIELQLKVHDLKKLKDDFEEIQLDIELICSDECLEAHYSEREKFEIQYSKYLSSAKHILSKFVTNQPDDNLSSISSQLSSKKVSSTVDEEEGINPTINVQTMSNFQPEPTVSNNANNGVNTHASVIGTVGGELGNIKLPPINIPNFDGDYSDWMEFKDIFESLIHKNKSLPDVQKYHYLRATLRKDALKVIQSLEFSSQNYIIAWDILCNRFNNSRLLVNNHIKAIFDADGLSKESATGLRYLTDTINKHLRALKSLNQPIEHWDAMIIYLISSKLDKCTAREWEKVKVEKTMPKLDDFLQFLQNRADFLETLEINHQGVSNREKDQRKGTRQVSLYADEPMSSSMSKRCNMCNQSHLIYNCSKFLNLSLPLRWEKVKELKLCSNCLCKGHFSKQCRLGPCKKCTHKHSTLLHGSTSQVQKHPSSPSPNNISQGEASSAVVSQPNQNPQINLQCSVTLSCQEDVSYVILSTAIIYAYDYDGNPHKINVILDSGSQSCFISEYLSKLLQLPITNIDLSIIGINNIESKLNKKCTVQISSVSNDFSTSLSCFVLPKIGDNLPRYNLDISKWKIPNDVALADPSFNKSKQIDMLIGAGLFWELISDGKIFLGKNLPLLQNTKFGYVISGVIAQPVSQIHSYFSTEDSLYNDIQKFWVVEEKNDKVYSSEDVFCENHFINHVRRDSSGKFVVRIPLKESASELGDSKSIAIKRFLGVEKKLQFNNNLKIQYISFMKEYEMLNHMELLNDNLLYLQPSYYLPHHGVVREESLTTKLRVVFDGSSITSSGKSLNNIQYAGPAIQNNIFHILLRFRQHQVVVISDISKMYRQILIDPEDRNLQRIFWRTDSCQPLQVYQLNTVTYGTASAPFLAMRCIKQLSYDHSKSHPISSKIIERDFYVDDLITGFSDEVQAIQHCKEIDNILKSASFVLRKWVSNRENVLKCFDNTLDELSVLKLGDNKQVKMLGIQWCSNSDMLSYKITEFANEKSITKRNVLSNIAKIYDPLGLLSPCIIIAKILIQELWSLNLAWDDNIPTNLSNKWLHLKNDLIVLNNLKIPRQVFSENSLRSELHGFCDSSQKAYSCAIYFKSINSDGQCQVSLLCAKTKVTPLKTLTIPKLELCGALILARLVKIVSEALTCEFEHFYWCDSQIVLHWINTPANMLEIFVGNRVSEIQSITNVKKWNFISSKENPADIASRGMFPNDLKNCELWWSGPSFLRTGIDYPQPFQCSSKDNFPGLRKKLKVFTAIDATFIFSRYSSLRKLNRVHAYCIRFILNVKQLKENRQLGPLSVHELNHSMLDLVKLAQNESFANEISILKDNKTLKPKHRLLALNPFIDSAGLLRVGGRLKHSSLQFDNKHPLLLNGKHTLTRLIIEHEHSRLQHAGPQLLLASVRQVYWPTSGMNVAKSVVRKCIRCFRFKPKHINSIMSDLPEPRVNISLPFTITGVDYAGPFTLKDRKGRGCKTYKAYICLFICFSSKAIHLELVTSLSTESFMATLRRFASRRGKPAHLYSDNGSNFIGAQRELKILYDFLRDSHDEMVTDCGKDGIVWHFIPPNSPNFGGLWESNIKGVKHHLHRVMINTIFTYEEFLTILVQIEATLNSRPLYPMSSDPNDMNPLTPSHFLIGKPLITAPDPMFEENVKINQLSRFQLLQQVQQSFWRQWSKFYLNHLQQRQKWKQGDNQLTIGTLVLIMHDNLPPCRWLLGRIIQVHPGRDNIVRVVTIKTPHGTLKRAVSKVCPLPLSSAAND